MAHRLAAFGALILFFACGGREGTSGTAGGGGSVTVGTGGSSGTATTSGAGGQGQGGVDWASCTSQDTCLLEAVGSCPVCETNPLSAFTAINSAFETTFNNNRPGCLAFIMCPAPLPPGEGNRPNYFAACEAGHCQPHDVRTTLLSACTSDDDCYLRSGTTCCGCGTGDLIAVSKTANVEQAFCGASRACAADCVSAPLPPGLSAVCSAGHCRVHNVPTGDGGP
jgi:hypothetical protein